MTQAIAYLAFNGNCAEAMRFYERALDAKLEVLMSGADSPMAEQIPKESAHRILHARLALPGGGTLFGGDCPTNVPYEVLTARGAAVLDVRGAKGTLLSRIHSQALREVADVASFFTPDRFVLAIEFLIGIEAQCTCRERCGAQTFGRQRRGVGCRDHRL